MIGLYAKTSPQPMDHVTRKRLWWKATKMSFKWAEVLPHRPREFWARLIYRILVQYPDESATA